MAGGKLIKIQQSLSFPVLKKERKKERNPEATYSLAFTMHLVSVPLFNLYI